MFRDTSTLIEANLAAEWLARFGVVPEDPGFIYVIEHGDRYKIGKSKNARSRLRSARTRLPDMKVIGVKPFWNVSEIERLLHVAFAWCWYSGEWFTMFDEGYAEVLLEQFPEFSDTDRDINSVDFIYWYNSSGMAEFAAERIRQGISLPRFLRAESSVKKKGS